MTAIPSANHTLRDIDTPALLVDLDRLEANLHAMADFAAEAGVALRPHVKTHKCPAIARMQVERGAIGLTCAKPAEAEVMADAGLSGLLIACPVVGARKIERLLDVARRAHVIVAADDAKNIDELASACGSAGLTLDVMVEVDVGLHRCGTAPGRPTLELAKRILKSRGLRFAGLLGYEGHCVAEKDSARREQLAGVAVGQLANTRRLLLDQGLAVPITSGGGTGTYRFTGTHPAMTEIQPGSYAYMDTDYRRVTPEFQVALTVLASVVSRQETRLVLDAGYKSVAIDHGKPEALDEPHLVIDRVTEEMTICCINGPCDLQLGDRVRLATGHCCGTSNLHDEIHAARGDRVEAVWPIAARGKSR